MKNELEIRKQIELLEKKALVYSEIDRVRMDEIISDIKVLEMKLLDLMVVSATID